MNINPKDIKDPVLRGLVLIATNQPDAKVEVEGDWIFCGRADDERLTREDIREITRAGWWPEGDEADLGRLHTVWVPNEVVQARFEIGDEVIAQGIEYPGVIVKKNDPMSITVLIKKPHSIACIYTGGKGATMLRPTGRRVSTTIVDELCATYRKACGGQESLP